jgi:hypothetical protein
MKKNFFTIVSFLISFCCFSQDIIMKNTGDEIKAKIIEVNQTEVKYKKFDYQTGPIFTVSKSDVFMIRYENGTKDVFTDSKGKNIYNTTTSDNDMKLKGIQDANNNYTGKNSGAGWVTTATILTTPFVGAMISFGCTASEPLNENLQFKDASLMKNQEYRSGYVEQAHKIKKRKVWTSFGFASATWLFLAIILSSR